VANIITRIELLRNLLQQGKRHEGTDHRDRRRAVGQRPGHGLPLRVFDTDLEIYMVKVSYHQKPYRRIIMENFGAQVYPSPGDHTHTGQAALAADPNNPGSLGLATPALATAAIAGASVSEAVEVAATSGGAKKYSLGSVLGHVLMHQTVVGQEALQQMEMAGEYPDLVIGCAGGGTLRDFAGFAYPFLHQSLTARKTSKTCTRSCLARSSAVGAGVIAVEPVESWAAIELSEWSSRLDRDQLEPVPLSAG
jgi:predicted alternative tryptophan synthase beta-subunit